MIIVQYSCSKFWEISLIEFLIRNFALTKRRNTVMMIEGAYKPRNLINNDF